VRALEQIRGRRSRALVVLLVAVVSAGALSGCSDAVDDPGPADPTALQWEGDEPIDLDGIDLAVGSKEPAAQRVLGYVALEALRSTGADVEDQINLGGTGTNREALLAGLIDLSWEYPAVGWEDLLQRTDPDTDAEALAEEVRELDLEENDVAWLDPAPAELGYGFVVSPSVRTAEDLVGVDDVAVALRERPDEVVLCTTQDDPFLTDPDGLQRFRETTETGLDATSVPALAEADLYAALAPGGLCTVGAVRLGEPAIDDAGLEVLEGDAVFLPLQPTVMVRDDVLTDAPEVRDVLDPIAEALTTEQVRALAAQVEQEGADPRDVARAWLVEQGFAREQGASGAGSGDDGLESG
jgi:osmoprotectant transport system substrate-binding protein